MNLEDYDLVAFGSGIYYGKIHKNNKKFVEDVEHMVDQKYFIFITSGKINEKNTKKFRELLTSNGFNVVDDLYCKGFNTFGPLKLIGGINKENPNEEDIANSKKFASSLKNIVLEDN